MNTLFMHCRPGFEGEVCSEISDLAAQLNVAGYAKAKPATAYAEFVCSEADGAEPDEQRIEVRLRAESGAWRIASVRVL